MYSRLLKVLLKSHTICNALYVHSVRIEANKVSTLPERISDVDDVKQILTYIDSCELCPGNEVHKFTPVLNSNGRDLRDSSGEIIAFQDGKVIRHIRYQYLLDSNTKCSRRCPACAKYRCTLRRSLCRRNQLDSETRDMAVCNPSSHTNYRFLNPTQKDKRMRQLHKSVQAKTKALKRKLSNVIATEGLEMDSEISDDLVYLMKQCASNASSEKNSFQELFWKQQLKAANLKNKKSMRWHPLIIKWCLYLQYRSSGVYETLRSSGVIQLPSGRTLRDYKHFAPAVPGFSADYDQQLLNIVAKTPKIGKYVGILIDEMYVKEGLVFDKHCGALVGFVNLGDVTTHLMDFEKQVEEQSSYCPKRPLAKTILVFMVRGMLTNTSFPYATFPASSLKGHDLFPLLWESINRLTRNDMRVLLVTCDGASSNRKLFSMHGPKAYKTDNIYSHGKDT